MIQTGTYYTWEIKSDSVAVKHCDDDWINNYESVIPIEVRPFFGVERLEIEETKELTLVFNSCKYVRKINRKRNGRTLISLNSELGRRINGSVWDIRRSVIKFTRILEGIFLIEALSEEEYSSFYQDDYETPIFDGKKTVYLSSRYERNPENRKRAIQIHGLKCQACGFDFQQAYGEFGKGFIEVHHVVPLSERSGNVVAINPERDLVCLCANCHRMIHRCRDHVMTVDELKSIVVKQNKGTTYGS